MAATLEPLTTLDADDTEILLVDDCGHDGTRAILDRYARQYANMHLIVRSENGGLSAARNSGLARAQGEYVYFLDSDDLVDAPLLYDLALEARTEDLDLLKARYVPFDDARCEPLPVDFPPSSPIVSGDALFAAQCADETYMPMVWQCLYKRSFLEAHTLTMPEGMLFEDELFSAQAFLAAARARMGFQTLLMYRQRPGSIMKSFHTNAAWCAHYLSLCNKLDALCVTGTPGTRALRKRIGQIALSVGKNIVAYDLSGDIRRKALAFLKTHRFALAGFALKSKSPVLMAQGLLLALSVQGFIKSYERVKPQA